MIALLFGIVCFFGLLSLIEIAAELLDLRRYPPPGRIVTDRQLHILEKGHGSAAVLLESGLAATSVSWVLTQELIAESAHVVAYDRAGLGWSAAAHHPPTLNGLLSDLAAVVKTIQADVPLVLVGHSFGGLLAGAFAHLHPDLVAGIVLVDPVSLATYAEPDSQHAQRLLFAIRLSKRGAWLARLAIVRAALSLVARGKSRLPLWIGRVSAGQGSSVMSRLATEIAKLPQQAYGPIRSHWSRPGSFRLLSEYLQLIPKAALQARDMPIPAHIPVIILSAASATRSELTERDGWVRSHSASRHTQIPNTTHWIQLDRPDLIADAVRQLTMVTK